MRKRILDGEIGKVRTVSVDYRQGWLAEPIELDGQKQASWRTDPQKSGAGALGDIGSHAEQLARFTTGLAIKEVRGDVHTIVKERKVISTADDVIHSFAVPAFGIKIDGVPGRAQDTWFEVLKEGTYYGQCSELCGMLHGFMPIKVIAVSESEFDNWVQNKKAAAKKNEEIKKVEIIK